MEFPQKKENAYVNQNCLDHRRFFRHRAGVCPPLCPAGLPSHPDARRRDRLETLAAELRAKHGTLCRIVPADLEQDAQVTALCEALADERIDLFINNAGFGACGAFSETDAGKELSMLRVNVLAMHRLFKFTLRKMEAQGFGTILNVASSAGLLPGGPYMAGYYASKHTLSA